MFRKGNWFKRLFIECAVEEAGKPKWKNPAMNGKQARDFLIQSGLDVESVTGMTEKELSKLSSADIEKLFG